MDDLVNVFVQRAKEADGFVFVTPVYYAHAAKSSLRSRRTSTPKPMR